MFMHLGIRIAILIAVTVGMPASGFGAPPQDDSQLSKIAKAMPPGTWAELETEGLTPELLKAPKPGRGLSILGWTDDAHWDPNTRQLVYMGLRQTRKLIAYREDTNAWREIPFAGEEHAPHLENKFGHIYSNNALDPERSRFYHHYHAGYGLTVQELQPDGISFLDLKTGKWTRLPEGGPTEMTACIEYFTAMKGLIGFDNKVGVMFFDEAKQAWRSLGKAEVCGYHSLARHNPIREEVLLMGGNDSQRAVARVTKEGKLEALQDLPEDATIRHTLLTVDPASGRYLILHKDKKRFYEFDSQANAYRLVDDFTTTAWPFNRYDMPVAASIPEYGVTMWVASKVWLYKHNAMPQTDPK
jgi:hypothetical protein